MPKKKTYAIVRFYRFKKENSKIIKRGLTLKEAQEHCSSPKSRGKFSKWFEGYTKES